MEGSFNPRTRTVLLLGLAFHLIYILSVFDCYFTSPVVHGMQHFNVGSAEAKRLVLMVGDGLRADLLYNLNPFPSVPGSPEVVAPYLRSIAETRGAFGVSHTRVPTESRPGHVAIIAGMYEDVSAVTKGWKLNPVEFDSVFNQSSHTYSFGSPDITPMFTHGAEPGRVDEWCYNEEDEDFTKDATFLDIWVLDQLRELLKNATTDSALNTQLRQDKVVFFLHLLGLDTTGHSYRPNSKEYMNNIQVVDDIVKETEKLINDFFGDKETSFIFTADHGMSNIGNHGDGNPDNTRTPLIAWGKGVRGPIPDSTPSSHDEYSRPWGLTKYLREDVEQADIAPLMATLIGVNFPANSVGVLPAITQLEHSYLAPKDGDMTKAKAAVVNAKVILEQYRVKHRLKAATAAFYKPFPGFHDFDDATEHAGAIKIDEMEQLLEFGQWQEACDKAYELIELSLEGLRYLQTYDRVLLYGIVAIGYVGWALFSALSLLVVANKSSIARSPTITAVVVVTLIAFCGLFMMQRSPLTYYLYVAFPCYFWHEILQAIKPYWEKTSAIMDGPLFSFGGLSTLCFCLFALLSMVAAYTNRVIWSLGFVVIGVLWPSFFCSDLIMKEPILFGRWAVVCILTALFPLRDVEQAENLSMIMLGGAVLLISGMGATYLHLTSRQNNLDSNDLTSKIIYAQLANIVLSIFITYDSVVRLQAKTGLPTTNEVLAWISFAASLILPSLGTLKHPTPSVRLLSLYLSLAVCFVILTISGEGLFYAAYTATLVTWVEVEEVIRASDPAIRTKGQYTFRLDDIRIALFFLFFVQVGFFGTGNVASLASFYLEPVYRLVPVFDPFLMAALLLFKIIAPFVILSAAFAMLNSRLGLPPFSLFFIAMSLTDGMTLTFFLRVTDTGSWLEIGQTISFFVITSTLLVFSAGICAFGEWLMSPSKAVRVNRKIQ